MMDVEQTNAISFAALVSVIEEMKDVEADTLNSGEQALAKVDAYIKAERKSLKAIFMTADDDNKGRLTRDELVVALKTAMPPITYTEIRLIMASMYKKDVSFYDKGLF